MTSNLLHPAVGCSRCGEAGEGLLGLDAGWPVVLRASVGHRIRQLPSSDMSGASWAGHFGVSIGSTRMRLDGPSIEVEDPVPGRFVWSERVTPELVVCGDGIGLGWSHDTPWRAWMAHDHVQIGHTCPEEVDPWPRGKLTECEGTRLEEDGHVACVAVSTRQYPAHTSMILLTRQR